MNKHDRTIALKELSWPLGLTHAGMVAEQLVRAFWPLWTVIMVVWAALAFDLHRRLGLEATWIAGLAVVAALGAGVFYGFKVLQWPSKADALDRLDRTMPGRPLTATFDSQAIGSGDAASQAVWDAHVARMKARMKEARAVEPDLRVSNRDPYALRYAALLFFGVAVLFGSVFRIGAPDTVLPGTAGQAGIAGPSWEAWIEPPAYTGKPTIYLNEVDVAEITVPKDSDITLRLYGELGGIEFSETVTGTTPDPEAAPQSAHRLKITQSGEFAVAEDRWLITAVTDQQPKVWFQGAIERSPSGEMKLPFNASDDYGVEYGEATITLDLPSIDRRYGLAVEPEPRDDLLLDLPMPIRGGRDNFSEQLIEDLSEHPWAGLEVRFELTVTDVAGQVSEIDTVETTLPGRRFFQPIAGAIVEQRRDLLWSRENAGRVNDILKTITYDPEGFFLNEQAYLTVRRVITRLDIARDTGELSEVARDEIAEMLWKAANLIEDGRLADARERLREARERLSEAMKNGATDEEIAELMQELNEAMQQFMQQLAQEQQQNGQQGQQQAQNGESQEITQDQLQEMLDEIERLMQEGRTDEAEQLLSQLMEMMENMQVAQGQQGQGQQGEGQQAMEGLQDTLREQQGLSDEAFRDLQEQFNPGAQAGESQGNEGRNGGQGRGESHEGQGGEQDQAQEGGEGGGGQNPGQQQGGQSGEEGQSLADRQERLRQELNRQRSQPLPGEGTESGQAARDALERADEAMGRAEEALREDDTAEALGAQSDAMEALREGMRALGDAMAENQQQQQGQQGQQSGNNANQNRDPLGREAGSDGNIGSDETGLLGGEDARKRSRALRDEIRRRSGELERPEIERDYLKRLLDQF